MAGRCSRDGQTYVEVFGLPKWDRQDAFSLSAWVLPTTGDRMAIVACVDEAQSRRGWELGLARGKPFLRLTHEADRNELLVETAEPLKLSKWQQVVATWDGSGQAKGVAIYVDGVPQKLVVLAYALTGHIQGDQPLTIGRSDTQTFFRGLVDEVQIFGRALSAGEATTLAGGDPIQEILGTAAAGRTAAQREPAPQVLPGKSR